MKALVINLASEGERMAFMAGQLDTMGIAFERVEAVTPQTLTPPATDPYWSLWERPMRTTEMAALASHRAAWARVAEGTEPTLILEDDALFQPGTAAFLDQIVGLREAELVSLETRGRRKLIARNPHPKAPMHRLWQDRTGAAAYVLRPSGAKKLLARVADAPCLADGVLCAAYDVTTWQAVPALVCQLDRCEAEGIAPPIATESAIGREAKPVVPSTLAQKLRRIRAQLRLGVRQIRRAPGAVKTDVPLSRA
jgi:glycosyl transferase family 25